MCADQWSRRRLLGAVSTGLTAAVAGCSLDSETSTAETTANDTDETPFESYTPPDRGGSGSPDTAATDSPYAAVYQDIVQSVAAVRVETTLGQTGQGTAWVYDGNYLVTNEHVVSDAASVNLWFTGEGWHDGSVVGTDVYSDLAVVEVADRPEDSTPISLVDSEPPIGTEVVAVGNPFGLSGSLSTGVISGQDRTLPAANNFSVPDAVQTDAAVNPGNSGGPLCTLDSNVVGVVNAGGGDNIGFAISAAMVDNVVPALIQTGSYDHSYMGVGIAPVVPPVVERNDLPISRGVYIDRVPEGGPADGVLQGSRGTETVDLGNRTIGTGGDVVYQLDGQPIPTEEALSTYLALETTPGETVEVGIVRDGQRRTVTLTLGTRPSQPA